ncbi:flagella protein F [Methanococcus vannielii SB]|jgi:flagellar protein FlaF|uniref:Flagella protein F n=1 Tax=Methanococcus vannielii (strain ATCC 35089 / DSM 1224 / JCM 13029 / OCM 148 / SB) TaxID=406327 RepID=A6URX7_METVS|nr:flagella protein F [Methanococcus vannielii]ABR55249.1 flagella protein F [Methanococcus vannielii SB]
MAGFSGVYGVSFLSIVLLLSLTVLYVSVESNLDLFINANDDHAEYLLKKSRENLTVQKQSINSTGFLNITVFNYGDLVQDTSKWTIVFDGIILNDVAITTQYIEPLSNTSIYIDTPYNVTTILGKRILIAGEYGGTFIKELY